jgi:hypothetical protein
VKRKEIEFNAEGLVSSVLRRMSGKFELELRLFAPPDQLRLLGRAKGRVVFCFVEQLVAGEFQTGGKRGRKRGRK